MKHDPTLKARDCAQVFLLRPRDTLRVDPVPIAQMVDALGEIGAEEAICLKLEDLTRHMRRICDFHNTCDFEGLATRAKSVVDLGDCIGLPLLAKVARDVVISVRNSDDMAVAATVARLTRIADIALFEVGNMQNQGA